MLFDFSPSPKSQISESPITLRLVNETFNGTQPMIGSAIKSAMTAVLICKSILNDALLQRILGLVSKALPGVVGKSLT
ncbi:MAG: Uncharacterised protein [Bacteroidia bacterium]|nr:MAG: Uncharacterised protein [Bacteroidia bacterium]